MTAPWLELARAEVERLGSIQAAAAAIGVSRSGLSLALAGKYPAHSTAKLEARVMRALDKVECPHLGEPITAQACDRYRTAPLPRSQASALKHWAACRACPIGARLAAIAPKKGAAS